MTNSNSILARLDDLDKELREIQRALRKNLERIPKSRLQSFYNAAEQIEYTAYDVADDVHKEITNRG
jgi:vacuolar-type H+-ATPase subunit E/Vma4